MKSTSELQDKKHVSGTVPKARVPRITNTIMQVEEVEEIEIIERFVPRERPQAAKWKLSDIKYNSFNQHDEGSFDYRMHYDTYLGSSSSKNDPSTTQEENAGRKELSQFTDKVTGYRNYRSKFTKPPTKRHLRPLGLATNPIPAKPFSLLTSKAGEPRSPSKVSKADQITAKTCSFQAGRINSCQNAVVIKQSGKKRGRPDTHSITARYTGSYKTN